MKKIFIFLVLAISVLGCKDTPEGYLKTDNAIYVNNFVVRTQGSLDPIVDAIRIQNEASWVSSPINGVAGTIPIKYTIIGCEASDGGDATTMLSELEMRGGGVAYLPYKFKSPKGTYKISLNIKNPGYQADKKNILTIIVQ